MPADLAPKLKKAARKRFVEHCHLRTPIALGLAFRVRFSTDPAKWTAKFHSGIKHYGDNAKLTHRNIHIVTTISPAWGGDDDDAHERRIMLNGEVILGEQPRPTSGEIEEEAWIATVIRPKHEELYRIHLLRSGKLHAWHKDLTEARRLLRDTIIYYTTCRLQGRCDPRSASQSGSAPEPLSSSIPRGEPWVKPFDPWL